LRVDFGSLLWLFFLFQLFVPALQRQWLDLRRATAIRSIEKARGTRVVTMIHRQETMNILGFPVARYIDIEDSEQIMRAIRLTPDEMPIDLVLHTPGGLVLAAEQIAFALQRRKGPVTVMVPHYAMSGGTLIAIAADQLTLDPNAVLGPVDPQLGGVQSSYPAASIVKALQQPNPNRDDSTLILGDVAEKALRQVRATVFDLLRDRKTEADAGRIADALSLGQWTHDYPLDVAELRRLGLEVREEMPREVYALMELYPQTKQQRPGVEFIPMPYTPRPSTSPSAGRPDR
jgi:ClpP class serine protease